MSPHVLPQFTAKPCFYRGEPIALLAASDAVVVSAAPGPNQVPLHVRTVRTLADQVGFRVLDRYLTTAPKLLDSAFVVYGPGGITFEASLTGVDIVNGGAPTPEWQELVTSRGYVLAALVAQRNTTDLDLRTLLSSQRAFGGYATAIDARQRSSRCIFLDTDNSVAIAPTDRYVFLDSNVLIHLEKAARGTSRDRVRDASVQDLAVAISHQVVLGGFAIAELSWDREANRRDHERAASLQATVTAWFGAGSVTRALDLAAVRSEYNRAMAAQPTQAADSSTPWEPQIAFYVCLLKLSELWRVASPKFSAVQRIDLYEEFAHWLIEEFGYNLSFPLLIAYDRLVGPQDDAHVMYVNKLMKFGKQPLKELWGAAWDLTHLANVDLSNDPQFRQAIGPRPGGVLLVTDDKALPMFRQRLSVRAAMREAEYSLFLMASTNEVDKRLLDHTERLDAIHHRLLRATLARKVGYRNLADWVALMHSAETSFLAGAAPQEGREDTPELNFDTVRPAGRIWRHLWRRRPSR